VRAPSLAQINTVRDSGPRPGDSGGGRLGHCDGMLEARSRRRTSGYRRLSTNEKWLGSRLCRVSHLSLAKLSSKLADPLYIDKRHCGLAGP